MSDDVGGSAMTQTGDAKHTVQRSFGRHSKCWVRGYVALRASATEDSMRPDVTICPSPADGFTSLHIPNPDEQKHGPL